MLYFVLFFRDIFSKTENNCNYCIWSDKPKDHSVSSDSDNLPKLEIENALLFCWSDNYFNIDIHKYYIENAHY